LPLSLGIITVLRNFDGEGPFYFHVRRTNENIGITQWRSYGGEGGGARGSLEHPLLKCWPPLESHSTVKINIEERGGG